MSTIRIKICGITRPENALATAETDADAVELVFCAKSKHAIAAAQAKEITAVPPPFVSTVALFMNEQPGVIRGILHQVPIGMIQFHGDENDDFYRQSDRPYLKAVRVQSTADIQTACAKFLNTHALSFDAYHPTEYGGTGQSFDWTMLPEDLGKPWILTGGLTPEDVADTVRTSDATTVDVSDGVENSAGARDKEKIAAFMAAAKVV